MPNAFHRLVDLAKGQRGAIRRGDAIQAGFSDRQLQSRVQSGSLEKVGPHTLRLAGTGGTHLETLEDLILDIGECWASGPTAAALLGIDGFALRPPFDVTVRRGRNIARVGHRVHTTQHLDPIDVEAVGRIPITRGARTIIDLARDSSPLVLTAALDSALRDGLLTERSLHERITALRTAGRFGIPKLLGVIDGNEVTRGGHSWLEREFLRLVDAAGLPRPTPQQVLTRTGDSLVRVDFRFAGTPIVIELLGYRYHRSPERMARDAARRNALIGDGYEPYEFTYRQLVNESELMLATITAALDRCARRSA